MVFRFRPNYLIKFDKAITSKGSAAPLSSAYPSPMAEELGV
jgi:hypothetical protein